MEVVQCEFSARESGRMVEECVQVGVAQIQRLKSVQLERAAHRKVVEHAEQPLHVPSTLAEVDGEATANRDASVKRQCSARGRGGQLSQAVQLASVEPEGAMGEAVRCEQLASGFGCSREAEKQRVGPEKAAHVGQQYSGQLMERARSGEGGGRGGRRGV